jgi:hypothetical protein
MRIAVEVRKNEDGMVESADVVRAVSVLMEDEEIRSRFAKMHNLAHLALKEGGPSRVSLNVLVDSLEQPFKPLPNVTYPPRPSNLKV